MNYFKYNIFCFKNFLKSVCKYVRMENPTMVSIDHMDKFESKEMKKIKPIKNHLVGLFNQLYF